MQKKDLRIFGKKKKLKRRKTSKKSKNSKKFKNIDETCNKNLISLFLIFSRRNFFFSLKILKSFFCILTGSYFLFFYLPFLPIF